MLNNVFCDDLRECDDGSHWINDAELIMKDRVSCLVLDKIVAKLENNDVFKRGTRGPVQIPVKHQVFGKGG
jgi:hypothetical protein